MMKADWRALMPDFPDDNRRLICKGHVDPDEFAAECNRRFAIDMCCVVSASDVEHVWYYLVPLRHPDDYDMLFVPAKPGARGAGRYTLVDYY
ncbi:MAG: hypothetical protein ABFE07_08345 [Armatimonadia bacterium]